MSQTVLPPASEIAKMSPMMRQYYDLKRQCGEAILFFRMGDFYEMFGSDATNASAKLDLVLTSRERGDRQKIPFCGIPFHSVKPYWLKLLRLGYRIAIADQVESAAEAKGLVRREITQFVSPGSIDELEGLAADEPNYTLAFVDGPTGEGSVIALADISTGEFRAGSLGDRSELLSCIERFRPKELLVRRFENERISKELADYLQIHSLMISDLPEAPLRNLEDRTEILAEVLGKTAQSLPDGEAIAAACLLQSFRSLKMSLSGFNAVKPLREEKTIALPSTTIRDLELFETARTRRSKGSLFDLINYTSSPMGARLLRWNLAHPFRHRQNICDRHEAVESLTAMGASQLERLRLIMKGCADLERLATRAIRQQTRPQEVAMLRRSLQACRDTRDFLNEHGQATNVLHPKIASLPESSECLDLLEEALEDSPGILGKNGDVFKAGFDQCLDRYLEYSRDGMQKVESYQEKLRQQTNIASLKIKTHKTFGLLIEVTKSNLAKVPETFIRRQTMVNNERFVTPELKDLEETIMEAQEQWVERENNLYNNLVAELSAHKNLLLEIAASFAQIDLIQSFAWLTLRHHYNRAHLSDDAILLKESRHPVVEAVVGVHSFNSNDIAIDRAKSHILITGPNMAGKSTIMRQVALSAILNQIGSFVPASQAQLPVFSQIYTRVGASDDLSQGLSTFMVEMSESAEILRESDQSSLVILDEVGRGTSTEDGLAIAKAILRYMATKIGCWSFFATHFHELAALADTLPQVSTMQTEVKEVDGQIQFSHRLIPGACRSSFGIEVAQLAGLPKAVITEARQNLEASPQEIPPTQTAKPFASIPHNVQIDDSIKILLSRIDSCNINRLTPLQALSVLDELQKLAKRQTPARPTPLFS